MARTFRQWFASFVQDRRGSVMVYVTMLLPVLIGFGLLAVDAGRLFNLQTSLQAAADSYALTGAAELDGSVGAIDRANNAIDTLVSNQSKFSVAGLTTVTVASRRYLRELPPHDSDPIDDSYVTTQDREAAFVEIVVTPATLSTLLPLPSWSLSVVTTGAVAVAGFSLTICEIIPLFMCNPFEGQSTTIFEAAVNPAMRRRQIRLRKVGRDSEYFPGNFAFLQSDDTAAGARILRENLAKIKPDFCYDARGVDTEPGQSVGPVRQGLNVRFDMYSGPISKDDPRFAPGVNNRKGYSLTPGLTECDQDENGPPGFSRLPKDPCQETETCTDLGGGRWGDGNWNCKDYWDINFDHGTQPVQRPPGCNAASPSVSRYEIYRHEIDNALTALPSIGGETVDANGNVVPLEGEVGTSRCSTQPAVNDPDRRILHVAIINCLAEGPLQGKMRDVPVLTWAKFFLTEPIKSGGNFGGDLFVELVAVEQPGPGNNVVKDNVQLYR